ncbi:hypothetical protein RSOLAG1IB_04851 [Rhizoctonia solani AG-1 IB]|uniref:Uncharacterized protein n=1 Tax=Thanatephorus cucumeris (strain AG1-IB / isolate 7/3/14) TaxID=1108050 RepID=A0A0B7FXQ0_THACB|nr:hypothetical protein RSOLAG1IB_04851 [Rhizoctonia solani AG-1 IB]
MGRENDDISLLAPSTISTPKQSAPERPPSTPSPFSPTVRQECHCASLPLSHLSVGRSTSIMHRIPVMRTNQGVKATVQIRRHTASFFYPTVCCYTASGQENENLCSFWKELYCHRCDIKGAAYRKSTGTHAIRPRRKSYYQSLTDIEYRIAEIGRKPYGTAITCLEVLSSKSGPQHL